MCEHSQNDVEEHRKPGDHWMRRLSYVYNPTKLVIIAISFPGMAKITGMFRWSLIRRFLIVSAPHRVFSDYGRNSIGRLWISTLSVSILNTD